MIALNRLGLLAAATILPLAACTPEQAGGPAASTAAALPAATPLTAAALTALISGKRLSYINSTNVAVEIQADPGGTGRFVIRQARIDSSLNWSVPRDGALCMSNIFPAIQSGTSFCLEQFAQTGPASVTFVTSLGSRISGTIR